MTDRVFVDTNVLVYAYDRSEPDKQQMALQVLNQLHATHSGVISTQVLSEFFVTVTRKLKPQLSPEDAYERIDPFELLHYFIRGPLKIFHVNRMLGSL